MVYTTYMIKTVTKSGNRKTGNVSATYREVGSTCPSSCSLLGNGCYAKLGLVGLQSMKSGIDDKDAYYLTQFFQKAGPKGVPFKGLIRHHVSGDVFRNDAPDFEYITAMNEAHMSRPDVQGWGYTHGWKALQATDFYAKGLTMNASCETIEEVKEAKSKGWDTVMVVSSGETRTAWVEDGLPMVVCPQQYKERVTCTSCLMCVKKKRKYTIVFRAHGSGSNKVNKVLEGLA
jgi:hypothetical protein